MGQNAFSKSGRNDDCPCGSGKKYKKCCLLKEEAQNIQDFAWHRIRQTEGEVIDKHLLPYVLNNFPKHTFDVAWEDFLLAEDFSGEREDLLREAMFIPWFLFTWIPRVKGLASQPLALQYLKAKGYQVSSYQRRFIETLCQSPYSFYVVLDVILNQSIRLKDSLLQTEHVIKEKRATHFLNRGDIIFNRILSLEDQEIAVGMGPQIIPSSYHGTLIDLRTALEKDNNGKTLTPSLLQQYDEMFREVFFRIVQRQDNPSLPILCNTDGELIQFCTLTFDIHLNPEEILQKLMPLTLSDDPEEFLEEAKRDKKGQIRRIEFSWLKRGNKTMKEWENTILGEIKIEPKRLTISVNSEARAQKAQKLFQKYLKENITYKNTLIESPEQKLKSSRPLSPKKKQEEEKFEQLPEVQDFLKNMGKQHWENWLDSPLPALKGKPPRKAVQTKEGRERVEALLLEFERMIQKGMPNPMGPDIEYLRSQLNLSSEGGRYK